MNKGRNDYCKNCETFNDVVNGVCCRCGWHVVANRLATDAECVEVKSLLDAAIHTLDQTLRDWDR